MLATFLYDAAIVIALANDALGAMEKESQSIGIQPTKIVSADEVVQCHNEKVECLRKDIKELDWRHKKVHGGDGN